MKNLLLTILFVFSIVPTIFSQTLYGDLDYGMTKKEVKKIFKENDKSIMMQLNEKYFFLNPDDVNYDDDNKLVSLVFKDLGERNYVDFQNNEEYVIQYFKDLGYERFFEKLHPTIVYDFQNGSYDMSNPDKTIMIEIVGTKFRIGYSIYYGIRIYVRRYEDYMNYYKKQKESITQKDPFGNN